jgi:hypothetical protein
MSRVSSRNLVIQVLGGKFSLHGRGWRVRGEASPCIDETLHMLHLTWLLQLCSPITFPMNYAFIFPGVRSTCTKKETLRQCEAWDSIMVRQVFIYTVSISFTDVNLTSITLQWSELPCSDRNGGITGYTVEYSSNSVAVSGSSNTRLVVGGLLPRTSYTFSVRAQGAAASGSATATTATPAG